MTTPTLRELVALREKAEDGPWTARSGDPVSAFIEAASLFDYAGLLAEVEGLREIVADEWTQLLATAHYGHTLLHDGELDDCPKRACRRAREVASNADEVSGLGLADKAAVLRGEMNAALHAFAETLPDDSEPVS